MSEYSIDVGESDFLERVLARSRDVPVLVDFWAPWCGPCRTLSPLLEKLAADGNGRFVLAKVDTDQHPGLAQRHQVKGIPAVKLFRDGQQVAEFVGALPAPDVRAFLDKWIPDASTAAAKRAIELIHAGDFSGADAALTGIDADTPLVSLTKARVAVLRGRIDEARTLAAQVPAVSEERELADSVDVVAALAAEARGQEGSRADAEGRLLAAGAHLNASELEPAMDALLDVVRKDRKLREDAGRKTLLALFNVVGVRSETSDSYRRKLADLL